jgi:hypothetical protein
VSLGQTPEWCECGQLWADTCLGHKDDPWVLVDRVAQVFYVLDPETGKHVVVSAKQKNVEVDNVEDNDDDANQFEEMPR